MTCRRQRVRIAFSGNKGFSLEIPGNALRGIHARGEPPRAIQATCRDVFQDCPTLDTKIYESVRLWRLINSRHETSGLYKTRLSLHELKTLKIEDIRQLATRPRDFRTPRMMSGSHAPAWSTRGPPPRSRRTATSRTTARSTRNPSARPLTDEQERAVEDIYRPVLVPEPETQRRVRPGRLVCHRRCSV